MYQKKNNNNNKKTKMSKVVNYLNILVFSYNLYVDMVKWLDPQFHGQDFQFEGSLELGLDLGF